MSSFQRFTRPTHTTFVTDSLQDKLMLPMLKQEQHDRAQQAISSMDFTQNALTIDAAGRDKATQGFRDKQQKALDHLMKFGVNRKTNEDFWKVSQDFRNYKQGEGAVLDSRLAQWQEHSKGIKDNKNVDEQDKAAFLNTLLSQQTAYDPNDPTSAGLKLDSIPETQDTTKFTKDVLGMIKADKSVSLPKHLANSDSITEIWGWTQTEGVAQNRVKNILENAIAGNPSMSAYLGFKGHAARGFEDYRVGKQNWRDGLFDQEEYTNSKGVTGNVYKNRALNSLVTSGTLAGAYNSTSATYKYQENADKKFARQQTLQNMERDLKVVEAYMPTQWEGAETLEQMGTNLFKLQQDRKKYDNAYQEVKTKVTANGGDTSKLSVTDKQIYDNYRANVANITNIENKIASINSRVEAAAPASNYFKSGEVNAVSSYLEKNVNNYMEAGTESHAEANSIISRLKKLESSPEDYAKAMNNGELAAMMTSLTKLNAGGDNPLVFGSAINTANKYLRENTSGYRDYLESNRTAITESLATMQNTPVLFSNDEDWVDQEDNLSLAMNTSPDSYRTSSGVTLRAEAKELVSQYGKDGDVIEFKAHFTEGYDQNTGSTYFAKPYIRSQGGTVKALEVPAIKVSGEMKNISAQKQRGRDLFFNGANSGTVDAGLRTYSNSSYPRINEQELVNYSAGNSFTSPYSLFGKRVSVTPAANGSYNLDHPQGDRIEFKDSSDKEFVLKPFPNASSIRNFLGAVELYQQTPEAQKKEMFEKHILKFIANK